MVVSYFAFSPYLFFMGLEFFPRKFDMNNAQPPAAGVMRENVSMTAANGAKLAAWFFPLPGARYTAIVHHGQGENIGFKPYYDTAMVLRQAGCSVLLYDYEGFGASQGKPSNEAMRRDAQAAYDYLIKARAIDPDYIIHCGVSLGSGPASAVASTSRCAGVILISPYLSLSKLATHHLPLLRIYPRFMFPQPDLGAEALLTSKLPVLVFHGDNDFIIPVSNSDEFCRRYSGPKTFIRVHNGYHVGSLSHEQGAPYKGSSLEICRTFVDAITTCPQSR